MSDPLIELLWELARRYAGADVSAVLNKYGDEIPSEETNQKILAELDELRAANREA